MVVEAYLSGIEIGTINFNLIVCEETCPFVPVPDGERENFTRLWSDVQTWPN